MVSVQDKNQQMLYQVEFGEEGVDYVNLPPGVKHPDEIDFSKLKR
jgi:hypothetical protein